MTRVGIVAKPDAPRARGVIAQLLTWLSAQRIGAVLEKETADLAPEVPAAASKAELPSQVDLLIVLGGDGTLLSMARAEDPNSALTSFFIVLAPAANLDGKYSIFGKVVDGFDTLEKIEKVQRNGETPVERIELIEAAIKP